MAEIIITIKKDGSTELTVYGVVGPGCLDLSRALEQGLGTVESQTCKLEFYDEATHEEKLEQRG